MTDVPVSQRIATMSPLKLAFLARQMRPKSEWLTAEPIAIVGVGCRFPGGADGPTAFWRLLHDGVDAIREVPPHRWDLDAFYDPNPETPGRANTRSSGFLDDVYDFDAAFFNIVPREAIAMDPQQRLLLEVSWEAVEHAGLSPTKLAGSQTGVFIGISFTDYGRTSPRAQDLDRIDAYSGTGTCLSVAAGRLSYVFGLHGPSIAVDTACSSSLVSVHLACQSLRLGECNLALAGGVNVLSPAGTLAFAKLRALSSDGRCKTFDAAADGYARGEGCGMVVLKRLSDAVEDGDTGTGSRAKFRRQSRRSQRRLDRAERASPGSRDSSGARRTGSRRSDVCRSARDRNRYSATRSKCERWGR